MAIADPAAKIGELKNERARLLAFAFARSDLLVELNSKGQIIFVSGAAFSLTGRPAEALIGAEFSAILAKQSKTIFREVRAALDNGLRLRSRRVFLEKKGTVVSALIAGCPLPQRPDRFYITLSHVQHDEDEQGIGPAAAPQDTSSPIEAAKRDKTTGLLKPEAFQQIATERLKDSRKRTEPLKMTMVDLEGLDGFRDRVDETSEQNFMRGVGAILNSQSEGGTTATQLAPNKFSVLLAEEIDDRDLTRQISELAREVDPSGVGLTVKASSLDLDVGEMNEADAAKALVYAVNKFASSQTGDFSISSLSNGLQSMVKDTVARVSTLRSAFVDADGFTLHYQPIVDVATKRIHHQEALARMPDGGSPFAMVTFIEEVGVITEFDFAVCKKVLAELTKFPDAFDVAVNISGRSMESEIFIADLEELLRQNPTVRQRVLFEITESSRITNFDRVEKVINRMRAARHQVCLDDFGSGAAAFHYLRAFKVDVVKIDGAYVKDIQTNERDRAFVRSILSLCQELGVSTVAEFIETDAQASILRNMGLHHGQGYLYDKPRPQIYQRQRTPAGVSAPMASRPPQTRGSTARWE